MLFYFLKNSEGKLEFLCTFNPDSIPRIIKEKFEVKDYIYSSTSYSYKSKYDITEKVKKGIFKKIDENTFERNLPEYDYFKRKKYKKTIIFNDDRFGEAQEISSEVINYVHLTSIDELAQLIADLSSCESKDYPSPVAYLPDSDVGKIILGSSVIKGGLNLDEFITLFKIIKRNITQDHQLNDEILHDIDEYKNDKYSNPIDGLLSYNLYNLSVEKEKNIHKYVFTPTYYAGEVVKNILSYTVGFHWFTDLSSGWAKHGKRISPPALILHRSTDSFGISSNGYTINAFNFWAVSLDIVARNLGKIIGWSLMALYSVPAYLAINLGYGIKRHLIKRNLVSEIRNSDKRQLVSAWMQGNYDVTPGPQKEAHNLYISYLIAKHVDVFDFLDATLTTLNKIRSDSGFGLWGANKVRMINYTQARRSLFPTSAPDSLEWQMLQELNSSFYEITNPESIYTFGKKLLDKGKADLAIHFLVHVRPDNQHYQEAMTECSHYFRAQGDYENARYYASRAGDLELIHTLDKQPGETPGGVFQEDKTNDKGKEKIEEDEVKSPELSFSQLAGIHGFHKNQVKGGNPGPILPTTNGLK